jgi:hypothetical protein
LHALARFSIWIYLIVNLQLISDYWTIFKRMLIHLQLLLYNMIRNILFYIQHVQKRCLKNNLLRTVQCRRTVCVRIRTEFMHNFYRYSTPQLNLTHFLRVRLSISTMLTVRTIDILFQLHAAKAKRCSCSSFIWTNVLH